MSVFNPETAARALMPKELLNEASSLHLCLHLSEGKMQVALAEASGRDFLWAEDFFFESIRHTYADAVDFTVGRNWSEKVFRKCTLTYDTALFTLVPNAFFDIHKQNELLAFNTGKNASNPTHLHLSEPDAIMVFEQDANVRSLIKQFPNARIFPTAYLFVKHALLMAERDETTFHIARVGSSMLLAVVKNKKLLLLNHFGVENEEDVLYHASNTAIRLNVDFENIRIALYEMPQAETLVALLKSYNSQVKLAFGDEGKKVRASFPAHLHVLCA